MKNRMGILAGILAVSLAAGGASWLPSGDGLFEKGEKTEVSVMETASQEKETTKESTAEDSSAEESEDASSDGAEDSGDTEESEETAEDSGDTGESEDTGENTEEDSADPYLNSDDPVLAEAALKAAQYDYAGAIRLLKEQDDFESNQDYMNAAAKYQKQKETCVEYPLDKITHVFFHTLIKDTSRAFDGDSDEAGYNQYMTTIDEFNKIIQTLYDKGYVMVSVHDMATVNDDGTMSKGSILLPEGKIPFVLSQDDVSYYHYMDGDGFAEKLIVDEDGKIRNTYIEDDGSTSIGDYDMVPLIDRFVEEHPDFSYHGRKGILAMTGYNGVLGYRTDIAYKTKENLSEDQQKFLDDHPDFDYDQDVADATKVAEAMKAEGWEFASHTWGHKNVSERSLKDLKTDEKNWENYVAPILGKTDIIIFAFGADIGDWEGYSSDNKKYAMYKKAGYRYFCNVDSSQYFVQITDDYFRQGRRNLDGYRMYYNPDMLSDLFNVDDVWDSARPTPVPEL